MKGEIEVIRISGIRWLRDLYNLERRIFGRRAYGPGMLASLLESSNAVTVAIEIDGSLIGYAAGAIEGYSGHIVSVGVLEEYRGRGVGRKLMKSLEDLLCLNFRPRVFMLEVGVENESAIRFYKGLDYRIIDRIADYYGRGLHAYLMSKEATCL